MVRDSVDAWRAVDGLLYVPPVTTYESSPLLPGMVSQATWRNDTTGLQVAFVTIIGGTHTYPVPTVQTGYDCTDGMWAFFSQFLTPTSDAPRIVSQPVRNVQVAGQPASFWVAAAGLAPLHYQWQRNGVDIDGATANWLNVPAADDATFQAVVSNSAGSVVSSAAPLLVKPLQADPLITAQPADQSVTAGQPASFTVSAAGATPLSYQWKKNGVNIAGARSDTLDIPAAITADDGAAFSVAIGSVTSTRAILRVTPAAGAPIILTNPVRERVLTNQRGTFSVNAWSASPLTYQWQKGTITGNMADIPGATESSYTTPLTTLEIRSTLEPLPPTSATLVLDSVSWDFFPERDARLRAWVEAGGHLVVVGPQLSQGDKLRWIPLSFTAPRKSA